MLHAHALAMISQIGYCAKLFQNGARRMTLTQRSLEGACAVCSFFPPRGGGRRKRFLRATAKKNKSEAGVALLDRPEVTVHRSGLSSHHCRWCSLLPALLPAWAGARVTTCQAAQAYARASLQPTCLVGASHPHS